MKHILTAKADTEGRNKQAYKVITWFFGATVLLGIVLRFIFSSNFILQMQTVLYGAILLLVLGFFIAGMIKNKTADWALIIYFALIAGIALSHIYDAGGWSAVFPAQIFR